MVIGLPRIKNAVCALAIGGLVVSAETLAQAWTIDAVMEGLRQLQHVESTFIETRHSSFLIQPLELNGTFVFKAPQTFIKETYKPFPETVRVDSHGVRIDQDKLQYEGQGRTQFIAADAHPLVEGLVASAKATMSGDKALLESRYELGIEGTEENWEVTLVPKEKVLRDKVESILILGSEDLIQRVEIREADGDWSTIDLTYKKIERNP